MVQRKVDFLPFAPNVDSNLVSQETWETASTVQHGFVEGKASAKMVNKALRQATSISGSFARTIAKYADVDVLDNGDLDKIAEDFKTAIYNIAEMTLKANVLDLRYTKRIPFDFYANYQNIVILLCKAANNAEPGSGYAIFSGKLTFQRGDVTSAVRLEQLNIAVTRAYNNSTFKNVNKLALNHEATSWDFRLATCTYNGEKWIVLKNNSNNVQNFLADFSGIVRFKDPEEEKQFLKCIAYYEVPNNEKPATVLNQEIHDSLVEIPASDLEKMTDAVGGTYYTSANKPTPSDLGAMYKELPLPDFQAPLNDDLKILHGFGDYDTIEINGHILDLATKSIGFTRDGEATYTDKSGFLRIAKANEPRFEKKGLLLETSSRNLIANCKNPTERHALDPVPDQTVKTPLNTDETTTVFVVPDGQSGDSLIRFGVAVKERVDSNRVATCFVMALDNDLDIYIECEDKNKTTYRCKANTWTRIVAKRNTPTNEYSGFIDVGIVNYTPGQKIAVWGGQLEDGLTPSSLIITTGEPLTRASDIAWIISSCNYLTGDKERTIAVEFDSSVDETEARYPIILSMKSGATPKEQLGINKVTNGFFCDYIIDEVKGTGASIGNPLSAGVSNQGLMVVSLSPSKVIARLNDYVMSRTDMTPNGKVTATEKIYLGGSSLASTLSLNGHIRNLRIWHQALTEEEIKWIR